MYLTNEELKILLNILGSSELNDKEQTIEHKIAEMVKRNHSCLSVSPAELETLCWELGSHEHWEKSEDEQHNTKKDYLLKLCRLMERDRAK